MPDFESLLAVLLPSYPQFLSTMTTCSTSVSTNSTICPPCWKQPTLRWSLNFSSKHLLDYMACSTIRPMPTTASMFNWHWNSRKTNPWGCATLEKSCFSWSVLCIRSITWGFFVRAVNDHTVWILINFCFQCFVKYWCIEKSVMYKIIWILFYMSSLVI